MNSQAFSIIIYYFPFMQYYSILLWLELIIKYLFHSLNYNLSYYQIAYNYYLTLLYYDPYCSTLGIDLIP